VVRGVVAANGVDERDVATRSAIAQRETIYNSNSSSAAQLNNVAESVLYESVARTNINFEPLLAVEKLWRDIFPGDFCTTMNEDKEVFHLQLVEVGISVSQSAGGSTIERLNTSFERAVGFA
jgi:hypothetical protein